MQLAVTKLNLLKLHYKTQILRLQPPEDKWK